MATVLEQDPLGPNTAALSPHEPVLAAEAEAPALRRLAALLARAPVPVAALGGPDGERVPLSPSVQAVLAQAVHELARGNAVAVVPVYAELTTQQAADLLNVSRPFLVQLLESGALPFHRVGSHRRVRCQDLLAYRQRRSEARRAALAALAREAQEAGLYE